MVPLKSLSPTNILSFLEFWQSFMGKLNTKVNMSSDRHPRTNDLMEIINQTMQTLLRCYCGERLDFIGFKRMVELYTSNMGDS